MASLSLFVFWTLFISSHLILIHSVLFLARFKGTQVVKLIVILISCHTSLLLDINLSGPLLSTLASHWNTVAAQGHLQHISMINHHLSLRTDLPCMNSVCSGVWGHLHVERKTGRERERQKEREPEEDRKAALHWSCHEDELLDSLSWIQLVMESLLCLLLIQEPRDHVLYIVYLPVVPSAVHSMQPWLFQEPQRTDTWPVSFT